MNSISRPLVTTRLDLDPLRAAAGHATAMLRTLGNEDRLLLLCKLAHGELNVSVLAARTGIAQPTLSQQLAVLRAQGLVSTRRDGRQVYYAVSDGRALELLKTLHRLFCEGEHRAD